MCQAFLRSAKSVLFFEIGEAFLFVSLGFVIPVDLTKQLVSACFDLLVHAQTRLFSQCSFGVLVQQISRGHLVFFFCSGSANDVASESFEDCFWRWVWCNN